ncbi:hypothetical protein SSP35_03_04710 [Streptomyces sp. NBRC 110611]|uniref:hypothetical protein n=1 Tax=Streptomyces sp. NBRC 110611 TaxID=1621259 RepID=UPI00082A41F7|nr:hypothetical protein [Streptomyces sp. NBRC 110611]GAU66823.1 hypothetical protein SSP35_03_04710 [Streptomyces sp. NBRC 110611]
MPTPPASTARAAADLRLLRAAVFAAVCVVLSAAGHMIASCAAVPLWTLGVAAVVVFAVAAPLAGRERSLPGIAAALAVGQLALHSLFAWGQQPTPPMRMPMPVSGGAGSGGQAGALSEGAVVSLARHLTCGLGAGQMDGTEARRVLGLSGLDAASTAGLSAPAGAGTGGVELGAAHCMVPSLPMLLMHLLAALAVGWLLRRGEAALWRLVRLSGPAAYEIAVASVIGAVRGSLTLVRALLAGLRPAQDDALRAPVSYGDDKPGPKTVELHHSVIRRGPPALALAA